MRILLLGLMLALGACTATPTIEPGAPVSPQGLVKVSNTIMDEVYVFPELDLSGYDELMIEGLGIEFWKSDHYLDYAATQTQFVFPDTYYSFTVEHVQFIGLNTTEHEPNPLKLPL